MMFSIVCEPPQLVGDDTMAPNTNCINRRTALRTGGAAITALAIGTGTLSTVVAADDEPTMIVDLPPTVSSSGRGQIVTAIYPGKAWGPRNTLEHEELQGFKLGPEGTGVEENGANAVRWRLVNNGVHGESAGVFFDASSAETWFDTDQTSARMSAIDTDGEVIGWGRDEVNVR